MPLAGDKFSDDFTSFDTSSRWYPCYPYAPGGAVDEGSGGSWNAGTIPLAGAVYNPFAIVSDPLATDGKALQVSCRRTTTAEQPDAGGKGWVGGIAISRPSFTYGYIEWRMKLPNPGQGMFPALWVFGAVSGTQDDFAHKNAEMDMLEVFGQAAGNPWNSTLHLKDGSGAGSANQLSSVSNDTTGWHTYGIDWQSSTLRFFKDGVQTANGDAYAYFYVGLHLQLRINYTVGDGLGWMPNTAPGTPDPLTMLIDYVNVYTTRPPSTSRPTPTVLTAQFPGGGRLLAVLSPDQLGGLPLALVAAGGGGLLAHPGGVGIPLAAALPGTGGLTGRLGGPSDLGSAALGGFGRLVSTSRYFPTGDIAGNVPDLSDMFPVAIGLSMHAALVTDPPPLDEGVVDEGTPSDPDWGQDLIDFGGGS